jgi:MFS family permease
MLQTTELQQQVEKNFPWNFSVNLIDIIFITMGLSLISRETVMPLLVSQLTDSKIAVGLVPAIYSLGFYLPQLLTANFAEGLRRKKPFVVLLGGLGERTPYFLMGLVIWTLASPAPTLALALFFLCLATTALANGIATPAWYDMIGKVIPLRRRGLFSGVGRSLGAFMGIVGAIFVGKILESWPYPTNFALLFGLAATATAISWGGLALTREPDSPVVKARVSLLSYFKKLPQLLQSNRNYSHFLISYSIVKMGTMATAFFLVYGASRFELSGAQVGLFTGVLVGSQATMHLVWGITGDRIGHKVVLTGSAFALALAALIAWLVVSPGWLNLVFVLLGVSLAGEDVSKLNIILEFCAPEDRPTYIGLTNTLLAPVTTLAPILGGWLAIMLGYQGMFVIAMLAAGCGGLLLLLWVREPRRTQLALAQTIS